MMTAVFAGMTGALLAASRGRGRAALALLLATFALAGALFLYEIRSPADGFRMPWVEVRATAGGGWGGLA